MSLNCFERNSFTTALNFATSSSATFARRRRDEDGAVASGGIDVLRSTTPSLVSSLGSTDEGPSVAETAFVAPMSVSFSLRAARSRCNTESVILDNPPLGLPPPELPPPPDFTAAAT